jgi:hypothetical protein
MGSKKLRFAVLQAIFCNPPEQNNYNAPHLKLLEKIDAKHRIVLNGYLDLSLFNFLDPILSNCSIGQGFFEQQSGHHRSSLELFTMYIICYWCPIKNLWHGKRLFLLPFPVCTG